MFLVGFESILRIHVVMESTLALRMAIASFWVWTTHARGTTTHGGYYGGWQ